MTVTPTWTLVQQHWKPPPPSPVASLACSRRMYSPGAAKCRGRRRLAVVILVDRRPDVVELDLPWTAEHAPDDREPRRRRRTRCRRPRPRFATAASGTLTFGPSSVAHATSGSGSRRWCRRSPRCRRRPAVRRGAARLEPDHRRRVLVRRIFERLDDPVGARVHRDRVGLSVRDDASRSVPSRRSPSGRGSRRRRTAVRRGSASAVPDRVRPARCGCSGRSERRAPASCCD